MGACPFYLRMVNVSPLSQPYCGCRINESVSHFTFIKAIRVILLELVHKKWLVARKRDCIGGVALWDVEMPYPVNIVNIGKIQSMESLTRS